MQSSCPGLRWSTTPKPRKKGPRPPGPGNYSATIKAHPADGALLASPADPPGHRHPPLVGEGSVWPAPTATPPASTCSRQGPWVWPCLTSRGSATARLKVRHANRTRTSAPPGRLAGPEGILSRLEVPPASSPSLKPSRTGRGVLAPAARRRHRRRHAPPGHGLPPRRRNRPHAQRAAATDPSGPHRRWSLNTSQSPTCGAARTCEGQPPKALLKDRVSRAEREEGQGRRPRGACRERRRARRSAGGERGDRQSPTRISADITWPARSRQ